MLRILVVILLTFFNVPLYATAAFDDFNRSLKLGEVKMSVTSANHEAKAHFILGLKFLHAFMYELAREQFQMAQKHDARLIMAYWGEAMTYKQSLWREESLKNAAKVLKRIPKEAIKLTPIEKGLLHAVMVLFEPGVSQKKRDNHYMDVLDKLSKQFPHDVEANSFYALSLLQYGVDFPNDAVNQANLKKARHRLKIFFKRYPKHIGVMHYLIHAYDSPNKSIAEQALPAANAALKEISSSSHITHMSAHVYRRLGLWKDYIEANSASVRASETLCYEWASLKKDEKTLQNLEICNAENKYHSLEWLQYGYLFTGQTDKARHVFRRTQDTALKTNTIDFKQWYYRLFARQVLMGGDYHLPLIKVEPISEEGALYWSLYSECGAHLANAVLAHKQKRRDYLYSSKKRLVQLIKLSDTIEAPFIKKTCQMHLAGLNAMLALEQKKNDESKRYLKLMYLIEKNNPSTELTPSLVFLDVADFEKKTMPIIGEIKMTRKVD